MLPAVFPLFAGRSSGASLIEALVALLVLCLGVLGVAAMQLTALRQTEAAGHAAQASLIMLDASERVRANPRQQSDYRFDISGPCQHATVHGARLLQDLADLTEAVTCRLPHARLRVQVDDGYLQSDLSWSARRLHTDEPEMELHARTLLSP
ncbi:type IV pilus modification protein PilV [Halopseudomonas yangmingensis]|uniref:Type IV pilus assembly protein PilV n=1 Tax=Halopseudomonas yangmingensis TaxID=1720063 RepID=A0A1I4P1G6_9GAMM|nr:type IV pilus modification protein PilV [Halopseudomonas yangmingensis]SFM21367.1 type IV pilus assembly protein PilV [Halopseudomonas yangmingensis]